MAQGLSFGVRLLEGFPASWSGSRRKPKAKGHILSNSGRRAVKSIDFKYKAQCVSERVSLVKKKLLVSYNLC